MDIWSIYYAGEAFVYMIKEHPIVSAMATFGAYLCVRQIKNDFLDWLNGVEKDEA